MLAPEWAKGSLNPGALAFKNKRENKEEEKKDAVHRCPEIRINLPARLRSRIIGDSEATRV
jgi:uncharacterized protein YbbK (DUF523 family)